MKWISTPPTQPGWYWVWDAGYPEEIVQITRHPDGLIVRDTFGAKCGLANYLLTLKAAVWSDRPVALPEPDKSGQSC